MSDAYRIAPQFGNTLPRLSDPLLVVMFSGWIDTSVAAGNAMESLISETGATMLLEFDTDLFVDYRARRPTMELREGVNTKLDWSAPHLMIGHDVNHRDVLLLTGPEPDSRWKQFANEVATLSTTLGVRRMLGLGAYPVATPHTRAVQISCTSPNAPLIQTLP